MLRIYIYIYTDVIWRHIISSLSTSVTFGTSLTRCRSGMAPGCVASKDGTHVMFWPWPQINGDQRGPRKLWKLWKLCREA